MSTISNRTNYLALYQDPTHQDIPAADDASTVRFENAVSRLFTYLHADLNKMTKGNEGKLKRAFIREIKKLPRRLRENDFELPELLSTRPPKIKSSFYGAATLVSIEFEQLLETMPDKQLADILLNTLKANYPDYASPHGNDKSQRINASRTRHVTATGRDDGHLDLEEALVVLVKSLEREISQQFPHGNYQKASKRIIDELMLLPTKLREPAQEERPEKNREEHSSFVSMLWSVKTGFGSTIEQLSDQDLIALLRKSLDSTYPQYTAPVFGAVQKQTDTAPPAEPAGISLDTSTIEAYSEDSSGAITCSEEEASNPSTGSEEELNIKWMPLFALALDTMDDNLRVSTIKGWLEKLKDEPSYRNEKRVWSLFIRIVDYLPVLWDETLEKYDSVIESAYIAGVFDEVIKSFDLSSADDQKFIKALYNSMLKELFNLEKSACLRKYTEHLRLYPFLADNNSLAYIINPACLVLMIQHCVDQNPEPIKVMANFLLAYPKTPDEKDLLETIEQFFNGLSMNDSMYRSPFNGLVHDEECDKAIIEVAKRAFRMRNCDKKKFLDLLSKAHSPLLSDYIYKMLTTEFAPNEKNHKKSADFFVGSLEFFSKVITRVVSSCSEETFLNFKENQLKKLTALLKNYQLSSACNKLCKAVVFRELEIAVPDGGYDLLHVLSPFLGILAGNQELIEGLNKPLIKYLIRKTNFNNNFPAVPLYQRIDTLYDLFLSKIKSIRSKKSIPDEKQPIVVQTLRTLVHEAAAHPTHSADILLCFFKFLNEKTKGNITETEENSKIFFNDVLKAFNQAVIQIETSASERPARTNTIRHLWKQILKRFFSHQHSLKWIQSCLEQNKAAADDYETFLSHSLLYLKSGLKTPSEIGSTSQDQLKVMEGLLESVVIFKAIWPSHSISRPEKENIWTCLFDEWINIVARISAVCPSPGNPVSEGLLQMVGMALNAMMQTIDLDLKNCLSDTAKKFNTHEINYKEIYATLSFLNGSVQKLLDSSCLPGRPGKVFIDRVIDMGLRLLDNVIESKEERMALARKLLIFSAEHREEFEKHPGRLIRVYNLALSALRKDTITEFTYRDQDDNQVTYKIDPLDDDGAQKNLNMEMPFDQKQKMEQILELIQTTFVSHHNSNGLLFAFPLLNIYLELAHPETLAFDGLNLFIAEIIKTPFDGNEIDINDFTVYTRLLKFVNERMNKNPFTKTVEMPGQGINGAIYAFTKSNDPDIHGKFRILLSTVIKGCLTFFVSSKKSVKNQQEYEAREKFFELICKFSNRCKERGLADEPSGAPNESAQIWRKTIKQLQDDYQKTEKCKKEILDGMSAMLNIILNETNIKG